MVRIRNSWGSLVVFGFVSLLAATYRFRCPHGKRRVRHEDAGGYLLAVWHQNLLAGILAQSGRAHCVMVSRSRDGQWVSDLCERLGHRVLRGSSRRAGVDKGGAQAKHEMIEALLDGLPGAITVDGPRGPAHEVKPGIVDMARLSGRSIVPYLPLPRRYWSFPSWDAFRLPLPFTRIDVHYGAPIAVPVDLDVEGLADCRLRIAQALIALELRARSPH